MRQEILLQGGNKELYFNESQFAFSSDERVVTWERHREHIQISYIIILCIIKGAPKIEVELYWTYP